MLAFNKKTIKAQLSLAAIHNYASLVYNNLPNIYKIVVCNTQNEEDVSSSTKEGPKMERGVGFFMTLSY